MKKYLFNQPAGLGDILFTMAVAQKYNDEGYTIIWPTSFHYHLHQKNFPEVKFIPKDHFGLYNLYDAKREICEDSSYRIFPIRWADVIIHGKSNPATCMKDKYDFLGFPMDIWRTFRITRDHEMEDKLFGSLGLLENEEFNLINENQTGIFQKTKIEVNNGLRNVYMNHDDPQYNMLDWLKVMYKAKTIHTVATSTLVLLDSLTDLPAEEKHIYKRIWDTDHSWYDYYLGQTYIFH
jgi:hypothetical protein